MSPLTKPINLSQIQLSWSQALPKQYIIHYNEPPTAQLKFDFRHLQGAFNRMEATVLTRAHNTDPRKRAVVASKELEYDTRIKAGEYSGAANFGTGEAEFAIKPSFPSTAGDGDRYIVEVHVTLKIVKDGKTCVVAVGSIASDEEGIEVW
ncbi:hypothetical protein B0T16DRAFT_384023 [Cercophora newfieldiana]|uniref:Uncharacterized protein n=1 Tax=Cercophora newfieldiana TaxID=92897 RepID=A0AA40CYC9_9PEZI|nr:hypothetical protein B0T16DRAFT_384023 [Cercophora newfieldiana]